MAIHINKIITSTETKQAGKHKIPRFLYHLTTKESYESILKDGFIKESTTDIAQKGVFAIDLNNFFKCWSKKKANDDESLIEKLITYIGEGKESLVILKIPTNILNQNELIIRSQKICFGAVEEFKDKLFAALKNSRIQNPEEARKRALVEALPPKFAHHIIKGAPALQARLFKMRKEAIEYIYPHEIPIGNIKKIGEINITKIFSDKNFSMEYPLKSFFTELLKGTPEEKAARKINC